MSKLCSVGIRLVVSVIFLFGLIFFHFPTTDHNKNKKQTSVKNKVDEEVYWGNYYRMKIKEIGLEPYKIPVNTSCQNRFYEKIEDNMKKVLQYPVIKPIKKIYSTIFDEFKKPVTSRKILEQFPVFVTAASSNHYKETITMIQSIKETMVPRYNGLKIVFFDLGLRKSQRKQLKTFCNCEIRDFPFQNFPRFASKRFNYVWKPLIIVTMLKEYNFITWADSSIVFNGSKTATDLFFQRAKEVGILVRKVHSKSTSIQYTKEETFTFLNETTCLFDLVQLESGFITIWKTTFTWKYIIQPWVACALTENCMSHPNPMEVLHCNRRKPFHKCHRFDQSVLSIILQRIFNVNYDIITLNNLERIEDVVRQF